MHVDGLCFHWTCNDSSILYHYSLISCLHLLFDVFRPLVESGKNPQKYIKYAVDDLERMLGEFFEGKNVNEPRR